MPNKQQERSNDECKLNSVNLDDDDNNDPNG